MTMTNVPAEPIRPLARPRQKKSTTGRRMVKASEALMGKRIGQLMVIFKLNKADAKGQTRLVCHCDCGRRIVIPRYYLLRPNNPKSDCGFCSGNRRPENYKPIAMSLNPEYHIWLGMKMRCYSEKHIAYKDYGGRGIQVHDDWFSDFYAFFQYIGPIPSPFHSIDRIDNDGNYEPGNVRWSTAKEQRKNQRPRKSA